MFALKLFGGASIEGPAGPLTGRAAQRHRLALLAILATNPRGVTRDKLIAYLWPERGPDRARHALSDSIYRIHTALGEDIVDAAGDELRLDPQRLPSDVAAFEQALERSHWQSAVDSYAGPFLDGFHLPDAAEFERWVDGERERLARRFSIALESLAEQRAARGDLRGAVEAWHRRAANDRYDSRVAIRLMEALEAAGNRAGALKHARIHSQLLEQEFGTEPDPEVAAFAERLRGKSAAEEERHGVVEERPVESVRPRKSKEPPRTAVPENAESANAPDQDEGRGGEPESRGREPEPHQPVSSRPQPREPRWRAAWRRSGPRIAILGTVLLIAVAGIGLIWESRGESGAPAASSRSIAVLPFENLSTDEENQFFADGVTEDILTNLSRIGELRVIARASVMPYRETGIPIPEIAEELGVGYILEGSVRRAGDRVRINAQLVDVRDNTHVWAENYDRRLEDVFAVQSEIATMVARALEAEIGPAVTQRIEQAPTQDLEAYNFYLRGRYFWHRRTEQDLLESARFFERAVERDPDYARAWAGLADAYAVLAFYDYLPPRTAYPRAKEAATRALAIDESLAEAHASLGYITLYYDWDAATSETEFRRAIELNPSYSVGHQWYANLLVATGRFEEAAREMSRAREVNPLSLIANGALGWVYYYAGRHEDAIEQCELALEMDPDWDLAFLWRGLALEELGRTDDAIASLRRAVELSGGSGISVAALAHARAGAGQVDEARELLESMLRTREEGRYLPSFEIAKVYVALGEEEEAIRWLERAREERSHSIVFLKVDPQLAPIRSEPAFRRLVESVGLED